MIIYYGKESGRRQQYVADEKMSIWLAPQQ